MAGEVSKKDMESLLMQVMLAAKNVRAQRDRLLQLQRRLQAAPDEDKLGDLASDLFKVYYIGLEAGARMLMICLRLAAEKGGEVDKALDYLFRACRIASLAVTVLSRFLDPKDAASLAEFCDARAYISEDGPYPSSD